MEDALGPEHPDVAVSLDHVAGLYMKLNEPDKAEPLYRRALSIRENSLGPHANVATNLDYLAVLYEKLGEPRTLCERAIRIMEKASGLEHPDVADVATNLNHLARLHVILNEPDKAEPLFSFARALSIREKALNPEHPYIERT